MSAFKNKAIAEIMKKARMKEYWSFQRQQFKGLLSLKFVASSFPVNPKHPPKSLFR